MLFNPDDFRYVYVYEGDDVPLVTLPNEHLRPETPAWSFSEAKERFKNQKSSFKRAPQAEKFDQDLHDKVVGDSLAPKRRKPSRYERNRETARREKEARAITRASTHPMPPPPLDYLPGEEPDATPVAALPGNPMLEEVTLLPVLDRDSGGLL